MKHPVAARTVAVCAIAALGELALLAATMPGPLEFSPTVALVLAFMLGPPLFVAVMAWRRRNHAGRARLLFGVAVAIAVVGLGWLGLDVYRFRTDAEFRQSPGRNPMLLPLVQWLVVVAAWLSLVSAERREKNAAKSS